MASDTILLIEDNPDDANLARIEFEDGGIANELVVVDDGEAALRYLRREPPFDTMPSPGLVLLDLHLPKISGPEILREVEQDGELRALPIVVMSVPTDLGWVTEEWGHLVVGVLPKPLQARALVDTVATIDALGPGFLRSC
jgi:CheY-like chemotaxis protein